MSNRLFLVNVLVHNVWCLIINQYLDLVFCIIDLGGDSNRDYLARLYLDISLILTALFFCPLMRKFRRLVITLFFVLNNTISVLLVSSDNLFALIQSTSHFKSLLMYLFIFLSDISISSKLVSSAKWRTELFYIAWWRSLIYIIRTCFFLTGQKLTNFALLTDFKIKQQLYNH